MRLALAQSLLDLNGQLILIGEKREGIAGAIKQLRMLAPSAMKIDSARHCQVWHAQPGRASGRFNEEDWLSWHRIDVAGVTVDVAGLPGIFSDGRLDEGTRLMLDTLDRSRPKAPVLDFACGAGVIGAWLYRRWGVDVDGLDVQAQAVVCARKAYEHVGSGGTIRASDGLVEGSQRYSTIITNPPFHTGIKTDTSMTVDFLQQVARHLTPGGELRLVANNFLPYPRLIEAHVGPCRVLSKDNRFTVYSANRH